MFDRSTFEGLPNAVGVGYKPQHFSDICEGVAPVSWFEVHAENYMGAGGRPLAQLRHLRRDYPISVHGVGLSIGGAEELDIAHLERLRLLCEMIDAAQFSEHLAWSTHEGAYLNDLLPLPYTDQTLNRVAMHIERAQDHLGRQMLLENPSSYLAFEQSTFSEPAFLRALAERTGCGLLLDVNNIFVSATNLSYDPIMYIDEFPLEFVGEIHLGGHAQDCDEFDKPLLIDAHGSPVADPVWALLDYVLSKTGPCPILVEWDNDVPSWPVLQAEASRAQSALQGYLAC